MSTTSHTSLSSAAIDELCAAVGGSAVWVPGEKGYDRAVATWNLAVTLRPAVVLEARAARDVAAAVRWAARHKIPVGAHATGHGAVANTDGALLVNTAQLSKVEIDPSAVTASVGAGARLAAVTAAAAPHGLMTLQGSSGAVSVGGFIAGGGLAVLSRTFGLAADHVRSIDVVTADGVLRSVDAGHEPDLFWGLRGAKGNLGIITGLTLSLIPLTRFFGGGIFFDADNAAEVLNAYRRWVDAHTESTSSSVALLRLPPDPALPDLLRGRCVVHVRLAHVGDLAEGARLAGLMRDAAPVILDLTAPMNPAQMDAVHQDPPDPMPTHEHGCLLEDMTTDVIERLLDHTTRVANSPLVLTEIRHLGGAISRPPTPPNAVPGRDAAFSLMTIAVTEPAFAQSGPAAVADLFAAVRPWRSAAAMPNFLGRSTQPDLVAAAWPPDMRERLLLVKRRWDPDNQFRLGHALLASNPAAAAHS